jgi:hypothetical protein
MTILQSITVSFVTTKGRTTPWPFTRKQQFTDYLKTEYLEAYALDSADIHRIILDWGDRHKEFDGTGTFAEAKVGIMDKPMPPPSRLDPNCDLYVTLQAWWSDYYRLEKEGKTQLLRNDAV